MKKLINLLTIIIIVASSTTMLAQDDNKYINEPGYVNFGDMSMFNEEDMITEIVIEEKLLRMVAKFTDKEEDPDLSNLLGGLKLIRVNTFEVSPENKKQIKQRINSIDKELRLKKWDRIVKTKSKGDVTNVYVKTVGDDDFVGLTVVTLDNDGEATFVNIVGSIDLETINKLGDKFDIPGLDNVNKKGN
jgi:hypothetical protein